DPGTGQPLPYLFQARRTRHGGHDHVGENHMRGLLLGQGDGGFATGRLQAYEPQSFSYGDAQAANALFVIDNQQANAKVFTHSTFPMVFSTTEMNCCTRKGFSTQGAPVRRSVSTVCSLA